MSYRPYIVSKSVLYTLYTVSTKKKIPAEFTLLLPLFSLPRFFIAVFFWGSAKPLPRFVFRIFVLSFASKALAVENT